MVPEQPGRAGKKGRANRGSFAQGFDPRRHVFTTAERKRGYAQALAGHGRCADPRVAAWVWRKVRSHYRALKRGAVVANPKSV